MDEHRGRPNEGIPLSENPPGEEGPRFYYSRERRLAKAPESVRALYGAPEGPRFNILRPLLSSRPNAILFGTVAALVLITLVMGLSGSGEEDYYGNRIAVSAARYDGVAVITLKKTRRQGGIAYTGPLDIAVFPRVRGASGPPETPYPYHITLSPRMAEEFRFSVPFEETDLVVEISHEGTEGAEEGRSLAFKVKTR
jgi:hypothetical protein